MSLPLISIITPCYNSGQFIAETIESVLAQTYTNWELLVIDDCSTDNSADIILTYTKLDNRIKYLKTENPSGSPTLPRNIGIKMAKGRFIAFLDADDMFLPNKLEKQLKCFDNDKVAIVYSNYEKIAYNGERDNRIIIAPNKLSYHKLLQSGYIGCCTMIYDTNKTGLLQFKNISQEDWAFQLSILKRGFIAVNTQTIESLYRVVQHSRSSQKLKIARGHWYILRVEEKLPFVKVVYYFCHYAIKGVLKFFK